MKDKDYEFYEWFFNNMSRFVMDDNIVVEVAVNEAAAEGVSYPEWFNEHFDLDAPTNAA